MTALTQTTSLNHNLSLQQYFRKQIEHECKSDVQEETENEIREAIIAVQQN